MRGLESCDKYEFDVDSAEGVTGAGANKIPLGGPVAGSVCKGGGGSLRIA